MRAAREIALLLGAARDRSRIGRRDDLQHRPLLQARGLPDHPQQSLLTGLALELLGLVPCAPSIRAARPPSSRRRTARPRARSRSRPARRRPPPGSRVRTAAVRARRGRGRRTSRGWGRDARRTPRRMPRRRRGGRRRRRRRLGRRPARCSTSARSPRSRARPSRPRPSPGCRSTGSARPSAVSQAVGARGGRRPADGDVEADGEAPGRARRRARRRPRLRSDLDAGEERLGLGPAREALHLLALAVHDAHLRRLGLHLEARRGRPGRRPRPRSIRGSGPRPPGRRCPPRAGAPSLPRCPGICTSIVVPDSAMSGSPTPNASTRFRMFSSACSITSWGVPSGAVRITEAPPWRSRPSVGLKARRRGARSRRRRPGPATKMMDAQRARLRLTPARLR